MAPGKEARGVRRHGLRRTLDHRARLVGIGRRPWGDTPHPRRIAPSRWPGAVRRQRGAPPRRPASSKCVPSLWRRRGDASGLRRTSPVRRRMRVRATPARGISPARKTAPRRETRVRRFAGSESLSDGRGRDSPGAFQTRAALQSLFDRSHTRQRHSRVRAALRSPCDVDCKPHDAELPVGPMDQQQKGRAGLPRPTCGFDGGWEGNRTPDTGIFSLRSGQQMPGLPAFIHFSLAFPRLNPPHAARTPTGSHAPPESGWFMRPGRKISRLFSVRPQISRECGKVFQQKAPPRRGRGGVRDQARIAVARLIAGLPTQEEGNVVRTQLAHDERLDP